MNPKTDPESLELSTLQDNMHASSITSIPSIALENQGSRIHFGHFHHHAHHVDDVDFVAILSSN